jgi:hypothetical protein
MKTQIHIFIFSLIISFANLNAQTFEVGSINYNILNANEVEVISKPSCYDGGIVVPETVEDYGTTYNVIGIGDEAFQYCDITSIDLPNSITYIGEFAFRDCRNITSITLPSSVTSIGYAAFLYCTELTSVNIPENITVINMHTFAQCGKLTSITIPSSVTSIGTYAFSSCFSLATVNIHVKTPINITIHRFWNLDLTTIALNVPVGSESAYAAAPIWQDFGTINATLSNASYDYELGYKLYSNPASDYISISGVEQAENYKIFNITGSKIAEGMFSRNQPINIQRFKKGVYFINFENGTALKFVKN